MGAGYPTSYLMSFDADRCTKRPEFGAGRQRLADGSEHRAGVRKHCVDGAPIQRTEVNRERTEVNRERTEVNRERMEVNLKGMFAYLERR